jgi:hypothetical protein
MPRKLKLSPLQGAILQMLEEAGCEEISTILATFDSEPAAKIEEALRFLFRSDLVSFHRAGETKHVEGSPPAGGVLDALPSLESNHEPSGNVRIEVVLSDRGSNALAT